MKRNVIQILVNLRVDILWVPNSMNTSPKSERSSHRVCRKYQMVSLFCHGGTSTIPSKKFFLHTGTHSVLLFQNVLLCIVYVDQPIIWSLSKKSSETKSFRNGLGVQMTYGDGLLYKDDFKSSFAMHTKLHIPPVAQEMISYCQKERGCFAEYDNNGEFQVGCRGSVLQ